MSIESRPQPKPASDFWTSKTVEQRRAELEGKPLTPEDIDRLGELADELWPDDELEEFLAWLRRTRREGGTARELP